MELLLGLELQLSQLWYRGFTPFGIRYDPCMLELELLLLLHREFSFRLKPPLSFIFILSSQPLFTPKLSQLLFRKPQLAYQQIPPQSSTLTGSQCMELGFTQFARWVVPQR